MTGIVAHTYPEWWLKLTGQVAHWSTDYSNILEYAKSQCDKLIVAVGTDEFMKISKVRKPVLT